MLEKLKKIETILKNRIINNNPIFNDEGVELKLIILKSNEDRWTYTTNLYDGICYDVIYNECEDSIDVTKYKRISTETISL